MNVNIYGVVFPDNQPMVPINHTSVFPDNARDENIWDIIHESFKQMGIEYYLVTYDKERNQS